jgi:hypothetical protein
LVFLTYINALSKIAFALICVKKILPATLYLDQVYRESSRWKATTIQYIVYHALIYRKTILSHLFILHFVDLGAKHGLYQHLTESCQHRVVVPVFHTYIIDVGQVTLIRQKKRYNKHSNIFSLNSKILYLVNSKIKYAIIYMLKYLCFQIIFLNFESVRIKWANKFKQQKCFKWFK